VISVIIVVAVIILAMMVLLVSDPEDNGELREMTVQELIDDYEDSNGDGSIDNLRSFKSGDRVRISDHVGEIIYDEDDDITYIICESIEDYFFGFVIMLDGDKTDLYEPGDPITVIWHIRRYEINGMSVEMPQEVYSYLMNYGMLTGTTTSPNGAMSFTENTVGNYTGGLISLSDEVKISEASIIIIDVSVGSSASQGPPLQSGVPITTSGGMSLTYTDSNGNLKLDAGDVWTVTNGATGDVIKLIHETGKSIAEYTLQ
jgi:hypothetical protein